VPKTIVEIKIDETSFRRFKHQKKTAKEGIPKNHRFHLGKAIPRDIPQRIGRIRR